MASKTLSVKMRPAAIAFLCVALATGICFLMFPHFELTNLVMVYLLSTLCVALQGNRGMAALASILSVFSFDFFFVPPRFTFSVSDTQYIWTFFVMFITAMTISQLTIQLRSEAEAARESEQRSTWLLEKAKKAEIEAETERLRSSLLSSVSHDLRTPLAAILGSTETLLAQKEFVGNKSAQELLTNIYKEGERLSRLVQNLLEVTRLESGAVQVHKEPTPLEEVIGSALERLSKPLSDRTVIINLPEEFPLVPLDAVLMEQVFMNLLENATRHTPTHSAITLTAKVDKDTAVISLSDEGPGLKPDELERIFDKFHRSVSSVGSGLGLAICKAIVTVHNGRIWAENTTPHGAAFHFTLPLVVSSPEISKATHEN